jgi:serine/threonine protein kinase
MYLANGTVLNNRYEIEGVLGHGGFGITYSAHDKLLNVRVAVKEYLPRQLATRAEGQTKVSVFTGEARQQYDYGLRKFLEEAQSVARFAHHPNVVSARDYFEANGTAYMVMEYVEGVTLKEYLRKKGGRISFEEARGIMMPVMDALREVHQAGMLHRDISPDNIYLTTSAQVKILDFGAARYFAGEQSKSLSVILKSGYAPEEQYRSSGKQGAWTDIYAVGATIYKVLTGQAPPDALDRMAGDTLTPPSRLGVNIPANAERALLQALAVNASQRFQTMGDLQRALVSEAAPTSAMTNTAAQSVAHPGHPYPDQQMKITRSVPILRRKFSSTAVAVGVSLALMAVLLGGGVVLWHMAKSWPPVTFQSKVATSTKQEAPTQANNLPDQKISSKHKARILSQSEVDSLVDKYLDKDLLADERKSGAIAIGNNKYLIVILSLKKGLPRSKLFEIRNDIAIDYNIKGTLPSINSNFWDKLMIEDVTGDGIPEFIYYSYSGGTGTITHSWQIIDIYKKEIASGDLTIDMNVYGNEKVSLNSLAERNNIYKEYILIQISQKKKDKSNIFGHPKANKHDLLVKFWMNNNGIECSKLKSPHKVKLLWIDFINESEILSWSKAVENENNKFKVIAMFKEGVYLIDKRDKKIALIYLPEDQYDRVNKIIMDNNHIFLERDGDYIDYNSNDSSLNKQKGTAHQATIQRLDTFNPNGNLRQEDLKREIEMISERIRTAHLNKDINKWSSCYNAFYPNLGRVQNQLLDLWKKYDIKEVSYRISSVHRLSDKDASYDIVWNIQLYDHRTHDYILVRQSYIVYLEKGYGGWKIRDSKEHS